jgi:hypothetical protein
MIIKEAQKYGKPAEIMKNKHNSHSAPELISLTNQRQKMGMKESFAEKNQRIEVVIDTLAYLVMNKVDLEEMKILMKDLNEIIENS